MRRIAVVISVALLAGIARTEEVVGVEGLKRLPADTKRVRLVPDRSPDGHALRETDLGHLSRLKQLWLLDLRDAGRSGGPHGVGGSRWDLHLSDAGLSLIAETRSIGVLHLPDHPEITDAGLVTLASSLPQLENLTLRWWGAFGQANPARLSALPAFHRLKHLDLTGCRGAHDEEWPARIAAVPNLQFLMANHCPWTRKGGLAPLLARPQLTVISLGPVDDADLDPLRERTCPGTVVLVDCPDLTSRGLAAVASDGNLFRLDVSGCRRLEALAPFAGHPGLRLLSIRDVDALTNDGFAALGGLEGLNRLSIRGCPKLDESVLTSVAKFPKLVHLDLSAERYQGTPQRYSRIPITDAGLRHLTALRRLETLDLSGMKFTIYGPAPKPVEIDEPCLITDEGLTVLARIKSLRRLAIRHCPGVTDAGVAALQEALPDCEIER